MNISVIIPVFNASTYVEKAIKSALFHNVVKEVIVVNDGSTDDSLEILKFLQKKDNRIQIFHHENNTNKGRSASRNLAIKNATQPYLAFLDADDYFLPNRFDKDKELFDNDNSIQGVYNAIGVHFYRKFENTEKEELNLTTVTEPINPKELFSYLLNGKKGYFSIDGLTIKKEIIQKTGYFQEQLVVAEDTDWILKMVLSSSIVAGNITNAVAMRGVHDQNSFNQDSLYKIHRQKMFESVLKWCYKNNIENTKIDLLLARLFFNRNKENYSLKEELNYWAYLLKNNPKMIISLLSFKYCPIIRKRRQLFPILFR